MTVERRYAFTRVDKGDYLLPSNDGKVLWRLRTYTDGPSGGLDWPRDRTVWGIWKWRYQLGSSGAVDPDAWEQWEEWDLGMYETRAAAVESALTYGERSHATS
jgi:hypothetical protein